MDMSTFLVPAMPSQNFLLKTKLLNVFQTTFFFKKSRIQEYYLYCACVISVGRIRIFFPDIVESERDKSWPESSKG